MQVASGSNDLFTVNESFRIDYSQLKPEEMHYRATNFAAVIETRDELWHIVVQYSVHGDSTQATTWSVTSL